LKISLSSPDGLGDFVLRLPMIAALLREGHELQLLMRPPAADLAVALLPEVEVHTIGRDPWHRETQRATEPFAEDFAAIGKFRPDLFVATAFQPTFFDERWLAADGGRTRSAGFVAADAGSRAPWSLSVAVPVVMPEWEKARRLGEGIAGGELEFGPPRPPSAGSVVAAQAMLADSGLRANGFLVVCVGTRPGLALKDWGEANWSRFLAAVAAEDGRPMLFLGNPKEAASIGRIRGALPANTVSLSLAEQPPPVAVTHALISLGAAYVGRDSGLMHLAAATGRPLLALFGGGHWPRFVPPSAQGVILTRVTPCRGCNFDCPFPEPYCVSSLPPESVLDSWRTLGAADGLQILEIPAEDAWLRAYPRMMTGKKEGGLLRRLGCMVGRR
jgi:ADP-heptose:LPS heptosyltransferase